MTTTPFQADAGWLFGLRDDDDDHLQSQFQESHKENSSMASLSVPSSQKKKRTHPDPNAEVIALSPKTLMTTNRFICEVCKKGFQREQNLQLHRRGHNLPWKLKQKSRKLEEVNKRVYLCPEPTCVHHHPSRALGDLTGIKKHFYRKHGEKKWKCEKCSKTYAVQSDWKAHSKTCGTKEYRCDCGTLFSRRDSFVTHQAFCDTTGRENSLLNLTNSLVVDTTQLYRPNRVIDNQGSPQRLGLMFYDHNTQPSNNLLAADHHQSGDGFRSFGSSFIPPFKGSSFQPSHSSTIAGLFSSDLMMGDHIISPHYGSASAHLSATELLQKAAKVGSSCIVNYGSSSLHRSLGSSLSSSKHDIEAATSSFGAHLGDENNKHLHELMSSLGGSTTSFNEKYPINEEAKSSFGEYCGININSCDGLTKDFMGVGQQIVRHRNRGLSQNDFLPGHQQMSPGEFGDIDTTM